MNHKPFVSTELKTLPDAVLALTEERDEYKRAMKQHMARVSELKLSRAGFIQAVTDRDNIIGQPLTRITELTNQRDALELRIGAMIVERSDAFFKVIQERDALKDAARLALDFIDLTRRGCESGAIKSKPFINPDPDAATLEILTLHGESLKAIAALKAVL